MTAFFPSKANRQTHFSKPADTNAATIYSVTSANTIGTLEGLNICASGACAVTVWISNGVTDYLLLDALSMTTNTSDERDYGGPVMRNGWSLKVKTSVANNATFVATIAEEYGDKLE